MRGRASCDAVGRSEKSRIAFDHGPQPLDTMLTAVPVIPAHGGVFIPFKPNRRVLGGLKRTAELPPPRRGDVRVGRVPPALITGVRARSPPSEGRSAVYSLIHASARFRLASMASHITASVTSASRALTIPPVPPIVMPSRPTVCSRSRGGPHSTAPVRLRNSGWRRACASSSPRSRSTAPRSLDGLAAAAHRSPRVHDQPWDAEPHALAMSDLHVSCVG
jgi:hypothetical protein